jgi:hypothetical protein
MDAFFALRKRKQNREFTSVRPHVSSPKLSYGWRWKLVGPKVFGSSHQKLLGEFDIGAQRSIATLQYRAKVEWWLAVECRRGGSKNCSSATSSTMNLTWSQPGLKLSLLGEKTASNRLSYGTMKVFEILNKRDFYAVLSQNSRTAGLI